MKSAALSHAARPAGRGFLPLVPPPITESDMINDDIPRMSDDQLDRLECPDHLHMVEARLSTAFLLALAVLVFLGVAVAANTAMHWHNEARLNAPVGALTEGERP